MQDQASQAAQKGQVLLAGPLGWTAEHIVRPLSPWIPAWLLPWAPAIALALLALIAWKLLTGTFRKVVWISLAVLAGWMFVTGVGVSL